MAVLQSWNGGAFPWRGNPGSSYDTWPWMYPAQTNGYTYFNAFWGNQLPNWSVVVPRYASGSNAAQINRPWWTSKNPQMQTALQNQGSGVGPLQWGQQPTADYIAAAGKLLARGKGGGRLGRK
jgi:hypothetical protein